MLQRFSVRSYDPRNVRFGLAGISAETGHERKQDALPEDRGLEKRLLDLMNEVCKGASVGYRGGRKSVHNLYEGLYHIKRVLRGVWRDHGVAAVDLCFRVR